MSGAPRRRRWLRLLTLMASAGFASSVFLLQRTQPGYDPLHQLMSELALGPRGGWMLAVFLLLALGIACAALYMRACAAHWPLVACMAFAALMLCGAGLVTLRQSASIHVGMVALAFMALGLGMYLAPRCVASLRHMALRCTSWALGAGTALSVIAGSNTWPAGLAQRLAAGFVLLWLCWLVVAARPAE